MTTSELAAVLGCEVVGDANLEITGVAPMEQAGPNELTFLSNPKYAHKVKHSRAGAILISEAVREGPITSLVSKNPYLDFARTLELFYQPPRPAPGIHPLASIAPTASVGENAAIGAFAVVGDGVVIGRNAVLHPHVVIYEGARIGDDFCAHSHVAVREFCQIGNRVRLGNGVVVGGDGYGFAHRENGSHYKIPQSGPTVIEDDVEIQSLSSIDRATIGETRIKRGAKIDSLVQVGHACVVGEDNLICSQVGLAGSTVLGKSVVLTGQVVVSGHLTSHDNAVGRAQSGLGGEGRAGPVVAAFQAFAARQWGRAVAAFPKLGDLVKTVRQLAKRVEQLEKSAVPGEKIDA